MDWHLLVLDSVPTYSKLITELGRRDAIWYILWPNSVICLLELGQEWQSRDVIPTKTTGKDGRRSNPLREDGGPFTNVRRNEWTLGNQHLHINLPDFFFLSYKGTQQVGGEEPSCLWLIVILNSRSGSVLSSENKNRFKKRLRTMEMTTRSQRNLPPEQLVKESYHRGFEVDSLYVPFLAYHHPLRILSLSGQFPVFWSTSPRQKPEYSPTLNSQRGGRQGT